MLEETKTLPDRKSEENILFYFLPSSSYSVKKKISSLRGGDAYMHQ